ncbi:hypothetical protein [Roseibium sp. MB-4]
MPTKRNTTSFDLTGMMPEWPMPAFSNWAFAEREDRMEAKAVASFQKMGETMWTHAGKAFEDHMDFVNHRFHEDFECAKSLSQCTAPEETFATLQAFYSKMTSEYQAHFEKQAALMRESFTENAAAAEELNETAMETVSELSRAVEESMQEVEKPKARRKTAATS